MAGNHSILDHTAVIEIWLWFEIIHLTLNGIMALHLTLKLQRDSVRSHRPFWMTSSGPPRWLEVTRYSWWRHQIETFSALLAICGGIHRSPVNAPHKGQCRGALVFSLICVWLNCWVNNREAGDLRRYRAHYDVTIIFKESSQATCVAL